jgi:hypothetical protein
MTGLDLRPLSLGEILDRTFTLYRRNFLLFMGIAAIPAILQLAVNLSLLFFRGSQATNFTTLILGGLVTLVVFMVAYLISQGATIFAVTDLYLGRDTSIGKALDRVWGNIPNLFGVTLLNGMAVLVAALALVIPGIYVACRLLVCVPAALIEDRGPRDSLSRSWELTRDFAGRAFVIFLLVFALSAGLGALLSAPFSVLTVLAINNNPEMVRTWTALSQVGSTIANLLMTPIMLIATSVYYFDLRVRKEGFDLQFMLDPTSEGHTRSQGSIPSIL